jgi:ribosome-associated protein
LSEGQTRVEWRRSDVPRNPLIDTATQTADTKAQRSLQLALAAARTAHENQARQVVVLDMRQHTPVFDYFVIATGNSRRQLHAISEDIDHTLEEDLSDKRLGIEGYNESRWILLDYGSVVIHLFDEETRDFYALEDLWAGVERVGLPWESDGQQAAKSSS